MKKSFTLIELIFSMVIIAIAFTVLPKVLQISANVSVKSLKEEALFSAVALMGYMRATAWDEQNSEYDDILKVTKGDDDYNCSDDTYIRQGGFIGSRNCKNQLDASSSLGSDSDDNGVNDDVDDFSSVIASNYNNSREYNLSVSVKYVEDISLSEEKFNIAQAPETTNTKYVIIDINSTKPEKTSGRNIARLKFWMFNIGQIQINRIPWHE